MPILTVWRAAPAALVAIFLLCSTVAKAQLLGKWECASKSGQFDLNTHYDVKCAGALHFRSDRVLESTCSDGFFPNGAYWESSGSHLTLRDSGGKAFADFEIQRVSPDELLLFRKETKYLFRRVKA
jgi:hypothetical protein